MGFKYGIVDLHHVLGRKFVAHSCHDGEGRAEFLQHFLLVLFCIRKHLNMVIGMIMEMTYFKWLFDFLNGLIGTDTFQ